MNRCLTVVAIFIVIMNSAWAEDYAEIAQFAQSICGDIPEGSFTKTAIQGKVGANSSLLAKIISGSADLSASKTDEIYKGIPFDKLPDKIPTVSMCKSELVKIILQGKKQAYLAPNTVGRANELCTSDGGTEIKDEDDFYAPEGTYFTEVHSEEAYPTINHGQTPLIGCHITKRYYSDKNGMKDKIIGVRVYAHADCSSNFIAVISRWTITAVCRISGSLEPLNP